MYTVLKTSITPFSNDRDLWLSNLSLVGTSRHPRPPGSGYTNLHERR